MNPIRFMSIVGALGLLLGFAPASQAEKFHKIKHIVIIYQENRSFDHLYGHFPGANGLDQADPAHTVQRDLSGNPYPNLANINGGAPADTLLPATVPNAPWNFGAYAPINVITESPKHKFFQNQRQIDGGMMDEFATYNAADPALVMGYYDYTTLPEGSLAQEFTLCDNFFQAAFGGSSLNALFLIGCQDPGSFPAFAGVSQVSVLGPTPSSLKDNVVSPAPGFFMVNNDDPTNPPHGSPSGLYIPVLTYATIGDRLSAKNVSWKWYTENWNIGLANNNDPNAPSWGDLAYDYFANYAPGTQARTDHLQDYQNYLSDIQNHTLPSVSWIKFIGAHNEHPGDGPLSDGQNMAMSAVNALRNSDYWKDSLVIITYDEYGGFWDHVPPPALGDGHTLPDQADQFGPGPRIPAILAGPFARPHHVSHVQFDTTSINRMIESRWHLDPLSTRDAAANNLALALDMEPGEDFDHETDDQGDNGNSDNSSVMTQPVATATPSTGGPAHSGFFPNKGKH